jgi:hypothetical protein
MIPWRSLDYMRYILIYDLISLPSEISILGYFQEDMEEYLGVYIMEDMTEDIFDAMDPY